MLKSLVEGSNVMYPRGSLVLSLLTDIVSARSIDLIVMESFRTFVAARLEQAMNSSSITAACFAMDLRSKKCSVSRVDAFWPFQF